MFENLNGSQKAKAKADFKAAEAMHRVLKGQGKQDDEIRAILENMLSGKPWKDEILAAIFMQRQQRQQRQQSRSRWEREWEDAFNSRSRQRQSYSPPPPRVSLPDALWFFGFESMPDADSLKRRYKELALKLHPDKGGSHETFVRFQECKEIIYKHAGL